MQKVQGLIFAFLYYDFFLSSFPCGTDVRALRLQQLFCLVRTSLPTRFGGSARSRIVQQRQVYRGPLERKYFLFQKLLKY